MSNAGFFLTHILLLDIIREWIPSKKFFLPIPGFEPMPYLSHYLQATTLPTRALITCWVNVSKFCLSMNCVWLYVFVVFGKRSATLLSILYIVGGGESRKARRRTARPKMTDKNTKSNLIWVKFGTGEFTKSLIMNFDPPPPPRSKFRNQKWPTKMHFFGCIIKLSWVIFNFIIWFIPPSNK